MTAYAAPYGGVPMGRLRIAGYLNVANGILSIVLGSTLFVLWYGFQWYARIGSIGVVFCGFLLLVGCAFPLIAGWLCFQRRHFGVTVAFSVVGMILSVFIVGLIALILVVMGKNEFVDRAVPVAAPAWPGYAQQPPTYTQAQPYAQPPPYAPPPQALVPPSAAVKACPLCGMQLPATAAFCARCGTRL